MTDATGDLVYPFTPGSPGALPVVVPPGSAVPPPAGTQEELPHDGSWTLERQLFAEPYAFDFFEAVCLLETLCPNARPVGHEGSPNAEAVRFRVHQSLAFPASPIHELTAPGDDGSLPVMTVAMFGLTGPSGVLPCHYTELLIRLAREAKGPERYALRDWLDLFNHRLISLFHRAWEKYRFTVPYRRRGYQRREPDTFTAALFSLIGQGMPTLRNRLRVSLPPSRNRRREETLAQIKDLTLLYYGGLLVQRPPTAVNLQALLHDYFQLPVEIRQFQGQWLRLERDHQSRLAPKGCFNRLGSDAIVGENVWDIGSKVRVRLGPLGYRQFTEFFPDPAPLPDRKAFFLLSHLARRFLGPELDFDVQLVLKAEDVPEIQLDDRAPVGPRLGWNTWLRSDPFPHDADDAVIAAHDPRWLSPSPSGRGAA